MKVTVFGGSGFLGSHICDKLTALGHEVTIFDIKSSPWLQPSQRMIIADTLDEKKVFEATNGADYVYNFSGLADIDECSTKPLETIKYNILGNGIVLEACKKHKIKKYMFASSIYVYSDSGSFYRCSKQACESYIEEYHRQTGLPYTILRYGTLYGTRSDSRNAIYRYIKSALTDRTINYQGHKDAMREYIHVEDAAQSSIDALKDEFSNQNLILTGHQSMPVEYLFKMIAEMLPNDIKINYAAVPEHSHHYSITPYNFHPKVGRKYTPSCHTDLGQGILNLIEDVQKSLSETSGTKQS